MHSDFLRALAAGEDLEQVYGRLCRIENDFRTSAIGGYQKDLSDAKMIQRGLKEKHDSLAYRFAAEFLRDAQNAELSKSDKQKDFESRRQKIEEAYLKAREEETKSIREETDARRRRVIEMEKETNSINRERFT